MRKRLITPTSRDAPRLDEGWLDLDHAASVEVTSEQKDYGIEAAQLTRELKRSGYSSISHKASDASRSFSRKPR
jgi:hypothetical protein